MQEVEVHLRKVAVIEANAHDAPPAQAYAEQRRPGLVANNPCTTCHIDEYRRGHLPRAGWHVHVQKVARLRSEQTDEQMDRSMMSIEKRMYQYARVLLCGPCKQEAANASGLPKGGPCPDKCTQLQNRTANAKAF
jgi:hypothetical protein